MKKILILVIALLLIFGVASTAMAAQLKYTAVDVYGNLLSGFEHENNYLPTPKNFSTTDATYAYPNGIYLPNADAPADYRIHSNYAKNTDACAACHATHTAVGSSLLQWGNVYEACMACHDGTVTTTYNVKGGQIGDNDGVRTFGGMFGAGAEDSLSNHNAIGAVDISAAPGGTATANSYEVDPTKGNAAAAWSIEFGCQSCHTPHGAGGNARILNPNPNGQSFEKFNNGTTQNVVGDIYNADNKKYTFKDADSNKYFILKGYPYTAVTAVYDNDGLIPSSEYTFNNKGGDFSVLELNDMPNGQVKAWFVPALKVKMDITGYLTAGENVEHQSGMNAYCGACHTDYNTADDMAGFVDGEYNGSGSKLTGEYSEAYRHQVGMDVASFANALTGLKMPFENNKMTCETCHFAHGTTKDLWNTTQDTSKVSGDWGDEISGSSALKRLPNMSTCEACHNKGEGNEGYSMMVTPVASTTATSTGATYVGSSKCASCHKNYYEGWMSTHKSKKIQPASTGALPRAKELFEAQAALGDTKLSDGTPVTWNDVEYVVGFNVAQRFLVRTSTGYKYVQKQYYPTTDQLVNYTMTAIYQANCISCHTTNFNLDKWNADKSLELKEYITELGVGCEKCHGPAGNHVQAPSTKNIINPAKLTMTQQNDLCGSCHGRPDGNKTYPGRVDSLGFMPGDKLSDKMDIYDVMTGNKVWRLDADTVGLGGKTYKKGFYNKAKASQNPTFTFYLDGAAGWSRQQYQDFMSSKHAQSGVMGCTTCHSSMGVNEKGEQLKKTYAQLCVSCHGTGFDIGQYMPFRTKTGAALDGRSHTFRLGGVGTPKLDGPTFDPNS